ncbi:hypothetical protein ABIA30_005463 [Mycobacterium sp. MAA66]|uniref:hypothetical protein n=1 Tax=Mycobacterium sp. MAA66 TaxID=3156297 RepID=UPI0035132606
MRPKQSCLCLGLVLTFVPSGLIVAAPASADCTGAGAATVCAQGDVRGGGPTAPTAGTYYPSYCADPWYCDDGWDIDVVVPRPPRPVRPGGGGGIGPRN